MLTPSVKVGNASWSSATCSTVNPAAMHAATVCTVSAEYSHFALQALQVLGTNGIFVLTGVPGLQAFVEADPARLMRSMVLRNQVLLGTVNAGPEAFTAALRDLDMFRRRWPEVVRTLIAGRFPPEQAPELILGRPAGIKSVIAFDTAGG